MFGVVWVVWGFEDGTPRNPNWITEIPGRNPKTYPEVPKLPTCVPVSMEKYCSVVIRKRGLDLFLGIFFPPQKKLLGQTLIKALKPDFTIQVVWMLWKSSVWPGLYIDGFTCSGAFMAIFSSCLPEGKKLWQTLPELLRSFVTIPQGFPFHEAFHFSVWNSRYVLRSGRVPCQAFIPSIFLRSFEKSSFLERKTAYPALTALMVPSEVTIICDGLFWSPYKSTREPPIFWGSHKKKWINQVAPTQK